MLAMQVIPAAWLMAGIISITDWNSGTLIGALARLRPFFIELPLYNCPFAIKIIL
jgi:hypothetical protein